MRVELLGGRLADDDRDDPLAPALVGHADHRDLAHSRVRREDVLDLERVDVLAAGDDHVVDAGRRSRDRRPSSSRPVSPVWYQPSRIDLRVGVGAVPVAREGLVAREVDADLAGLRQPEARVHRRASGAARLRGLVASDREGVDLGRAVVVDEDLGREDARRTAAPSSRSSPRLRSRAPAPSTCRGRPSSRVRDEVVEERRGEVERRDPLRLDQAERLARIPAGRAARSTRRRGASRAASGSPSCGRAASRRACDRRSRSRAAAPATSRRRDRPRGSGGRPSAARSSRRCRAAARSRARPGRARPGCSGPSGRGRRRAARSSRPRRRRSSRAPPPSSRHESGTATSPAHWQAQ